MRKLAASMHKALHGSSLPRAFLTVVTERGATHTVPHGAPQSF